MLEQFFGQRDAIAPLLVAMAASERTMRALPHALFLGGPGRGKSTLARAVAADFNVPFQTIHGSSVLDRQGIAEKIIGAKGGILFIDEVHALPRQVCEDLYRVMDEGKMAYTRPRIETVFKEEPTWIDLIEDAPEHLKWLWHGPGLYMVETPVLRTTRELETILLDVGPICVLGATTDEALLPEPFYSRLSGLIVRLRPYTTEELMQIATDHAASFNMTMDGESAEFIALRSRNTPRKVKQLTERVIDWAVALLGSADITSEMAFKVLDDMLDIDEHGFTKPHRDLLAILRSEPKGLSRTSLAQRLRIPARNMEAYWGDLAEAGYVTIDTRHKITDAGEAAYKW